MERKLSLDQLAERSAKRKNKKIRQKYPLFAEQFAVSVEDEKKRIVKQRAKAEQKANEDKEKSKEQWEKGVELREIAKQVLPPEKFSERERFWKKWHSNRIPEYDGAWLLDFWWSALKGTDYAADHCPYKHLHSDPRWWKAKYHLTLRDALEITECPTCGMKKPEGM